MKRVYKALVVFGCVLLFFSINSLNAQNPLQKEWDKRYGCGDLERVYALFQTKDKGFILAGTSASDTCEGGKTQPTWGVDDYWVVKTDSIGHKEWDKRFGGDFVDYLTAIQQTTDGGYILGGYTYSDSSGDISQYTRDTLSTASNRGDYWIVKIDSVGNKQWDKRFGGARADALASLQQTSDGGYILGGTSESGISGDKTQVSHGNFDYWIIKTDSGGNKLWDNSYGGSNYEELGTVKQTSYGGYILGGTTGSSISGDVSEPNYGAADYWVIKIDSLGIKQWDKRYGGTDAELFTALLQTLNSGYILYGYSLSGIGGNKSEPTWDTSSVSFLDRGDYWIIKIDSTGNIQWQKDFGGFNREEPDGNIILTVDGGYLIAGTSYSNISGDKTENNLGAEQGWLVKTDAFGNFQWDKTILTDIGTGNDEIGLVVQTYDGCYAFATDTRSVIGGYVSQPASDGLYWMIKFCDTTSVGIEQLQKDNLFLSISPNPATTTCTITAPISNATLTLYDITGRALLQQVFNERAIINASTLQPGMYVVEVKNKERRVQGKLVVQ